MLEGTRSAQGYSELCVRPLPLVGAGGYRERPRRRLARRMRAVRAEPRPAGAQSEAAARGAKWRRGPRAGAALPCHRQPSCKRHPCEYSEYPLSEYPCEYSEYPSEARPTGRCCLASPRASTRAHMCTPAVLSWASVGGTSLPPARRFLLRWYPLAMSCARCRRHRAATPPQPPPWLHRPRRSSLAMHACLHMPLCGRCRWLVLCNT